MEENRGLILHGCNLAKTLEENLGELSSHPEAFIRSCDEIIRVFITVKERLSNEVLRGQFEMGGGIQEWLRSGGTSADQQALLNAQAILGGGGTYHPQQGLRFMGPEDVEGAEGLRSGRGQEIRPADALNPGAGTPSSQRPRRRKDDSNKIVERVPAPRMGNLELPPEDGFTWRKYGQKEILGSRHPRSYYRCTHQKLYQCPAKKQVQRLDEDYHTFEVTYRGSHTCNVTGSTAPSAAIPPPIDQHGHGTVPQTTAMQPPTSHWLSMEVVSTEIEAARPTIFDSLGFRGPRIIDQGAGPSGSGSAAAGGSGSTGPSTAPRFPEYGQAPVADLADAMFNSGISSNNSMDFFFPSMDEHWDNSGEKKN